MKVKFKDGTVMECTAPTEQKIFKSASDGAKTSGWILAFNLLGVFTSDGIDHLLSEENIGDLCFMADTEKSVFHVSGYNVVSSSTIRYTEDAAACAEIQITKGV